DETHAAVYEVLIGDEAVLAEAKPGDSQLTATQLDLPDLGVVGGKLGFEGLAIDVKTGVIYLMLERSGDSRSGCRSTIYRLRRNGEALEEIAPPIELELENCTWRHTGLDFVSDKLVALKTSYPGFEYQIVEIDPQDGSSLLVQDITKMARVLAEQGFSNNLEGMIIGAEGELYLVSDNRAGALFVGSLPPKAKHKTLIVKLPRLAAKP
ncbi:MAG: esterase-like activity of phytase family protein, partial [bacterium]|nr:esterase-like activity of phytase family protein [bacterium]